MKPKDAVGGAPGIEKRIAEFAQELHASVLRDVIQQVAHMMGELSQQMVRSTTVLEEPPVPKLLPAPASPKKAKARAKKPRSTKESRNPPRRTPAELRALEERIVALVVQTPGLRPRDIAQALGITPHATKQPLANLLHARRLKASGKTVARRYMVT